MSLASWIAINHHQQSWNMINHHSHQPLSSIVKQQHRPASTIMNVNHCWRSFLITIIDKLGKHDWASHEFILWSSLSIYLHHWPLPWAVTTGHYHDPSPNHDLVPHSQRGDGSLWVPTWSLPEPSLSVSARPIIVILAERSSNGLMGQVQWFSSWFSSPARQKAWGWISRAWAGSHGCWKEWLCRGNI